MYYYQVKFKKVVDADNGKTKVATALVDAETFAHAEQLAQERMDALEVISIGRMDKIKEVFGSNYLADDNVFYIVNVVDVFLDEAKRRKKNRYKVVIQASAPSLAARYVEETMQSSAYNMTVEAVNEAKFNHIIEP